MLRILICCVLAAALTAADHPLDGRWTIPMPGALAGDNDMDLTLIVKRGQVVQSWAINPFAGNKVMSINHEGLYSKEDGLLGQITYGRKGSRDSMETIAVHLLLSVRGEAIDGKWKTPDGRGQVAGVRYRLNEDLGEDPIDPTLGWTQWRHASQRVQADPTTHRYVDSLDRARFIWQSHERTPTGRGPDLRRTTRLGAPLGTGMGGLTVAKGLVYMAYYRPDGAGYWLERGNKQRREGGWGKEKAAGLADDYLIAIDANTGETVWQRRFDAWGINYMAFSKGGPQMTPVVWDDKVYSIGSQGRLYCLDAATGATIWLGDIGPRQQDMQAVAEVWDRENRINGFSRTMVNDPLVADGVVVVCDNRKWKGEGGYHYEVRDGLVAYDAHTGKQLWAVPESTHAWDTPHLWRHNGEAYVLTAGTDIHCIELKTGKVRWVLSGQGSNRHIAIADAVNILLTNGEEGTSLFTGYKITPDGAEKRWTMPAGWNDSNCITATDGKIFYLYGDDANKIGAVNAETGTILSEIPNMDPGQGEHGGTISLFDGYLITPAIQRGKGWQLIDARDPSNMQHLGKWMAPTADVYVNGIMPAIVDGRFFFRSPTGVMCYDLRDR